MSDRNTDGFLTNICHGCLRAAFRGYSPTRRVVPAVGGVSFWFLMLLLSLPLASQDYLFDARLITSEEGLANLMTTAIHRDQKGFLWIGTRYGLNRYDGYSFELYTAEDNSLHSNQDLIRISEDLHGNLWLYYKNQFSPNYSGGLPDDQPIFGLDILTRGPGRQGL